MRLDVTCYGAEKAALERFTQGLAQEIFVYNMSVRRASCATAGRSQRKLQRRPDCQNRLLAALAVGYGGVMTGFHGRVEAVLRSLFGIPDDPFIAGTITLGPGGHSLGPCRRAVRVRAAPLGKGLDRCRPTAYIAATRCGTMSPRPRDPTARERPVGYRPVADRTSEGRDRGVPRR